MAKNNEYVNGIFIEEKEGNYGPYLSISITEEGLQNLKNSPSTTAASGKVYRNFVASRQKNDNTKFSVKPFVKSAPKNDDSDDLIF